ncbi:tetratricopeptide repeat protein [Streptomyces sp. enrichment culture]|uniref:tetratricopeptide repeat protein n=1 Tax=Streptomyces sp. enrichment culture TaxID=1795815 RepID=UPI003F54D2EF
MHECNHAWALYLLGRFDEAEREIRGVLEAYRRRFGPDHPVALSAQQLLSRVLAARGHVEAAVEIMTDVVDRRERGLGADHPFTVAGRRLLGDLTSAGRRPPAG